MVSKAIQRAQTQVEGRNFEIRKHLLEYDDVMNKQREAIYKLRKDILEGNEGSDYVLGIAADIVDSLLQSHCPEKDDPGDWDFAGLRTELLAYFNLGGQELPGDLEQMGMEELREKLVATLTARYTDRETRHSQETIRNFERAIMLQTVDTSWKDHLLALDHLKEGIGLRGYGQRDPLQEYKKESYELFEAMRERVENEIVERLFRYEPMTEEQIDEQRRRRERMAAPKIQLSGPSPESQGASKPPQAVAKDKVGRNDPCPCGSGKKYKKCHGAAVTVG
jgi:preprotein translocase subunit SecA